MKSLITTALSLCLICTGGSAFAQATMRLPDGFDAVTFVGNDETLSCMTSGEGPALVLLHGWPETANEWDAVAPILASDHTVYACDLPGVRASTNEDDDFTKAGMADDIHAALTAGGVGPVHMVGHDIGLMVAYAYASAFPEDVTTLTVIDAPLPGTPAYEAIAADPRAWHFAFHAVEEVPEAIVGNSVDYYLDHFIREIWAAEDVSPDDAIADSVAAYSSPDTLRTGFEWYRAFPQDAEDNAEKAITPLDMPVLALNAGALSPAPYVLQMMQALGTNVTGGAIEGSGHWIPHEMPGVLAARISEFVSAAGR